MFKIHHNLVDIENENFYTFTTYVNNYNLRGNKLRLHNPKYSGSSARENFVLIVSLQLGINYQ